MKILMKVNVTMSVAAMLISLSSVGSASRVVEKDGAKVGWPRGTQLSFELLENYPDMMPPEAVRAEISQAMQLWNAQVACDAPPLSVSGPASSPSLSGDGKNTIVWVYSNWAAIPNASPDSPGVTDILIGPDEQGIYRIFEADLYLNAEGFRWTTELSAAGMISGQQVQYVKEVVAHELGHTLGLDHPCEFEPPSNVPDCANGTYASTLMFPEPRYVEPAAVEDDVSGLCRLYQDASCSDPALGCPTTSDPGAVTNIPVLTEQGGKCSAHAECQPNLACIGGKCDRGRGAPGDSCEVWAQCESGSCINGACRVTCSADEPCVYDQVCDATTSSCGIELKAFGAKCTDADECTSAQCLLDSTGQNYCTKECVSDAECPNGWQCSAMDDSYVCRQAPLKGDGCSISTTSRGAGWSQLIALLLGISLFGLRLRRHQRMGEN